jgi:coatomer protein complex subunit gamma
VTQKPFDIKSVPMQEEPTTMTTTTTTTTTKKMMMMMDSESSSLSSTSISNETTTRQDKYAEQLSRISEYSHLGPLFKSSLQPTDLTEADTEYSVKCIKHTFSGYVVFQFDCVNTLNDQLLEKVIVKMDTSDPGYEVISYKPCAKLAYSVPGIAYVLVRIPEDPTQVTATFNCTLKYIVKDCDPNTGEPDNEEGYEDEYALDVVEVNVADHVQKVIKANFAASWEEVGGENELEDTYALSMGSLEEAIKTIITFMGMQPCERTDKAPEGKNTHVLLLAGIYRGGHDVLVRAKLAFNDGGVAMQLTIRSSDGVVPQVIAQAVG